MSFKSNYWYEEETETLNAKDQKSFSKGEEKQTRNQTKINSTQQYQRQSEQEKGMNYFYFLLLTQGLIILASYYISFEEKFFDKSLGAESDSAAFKEYCHHTNYCQKLIFNDEKDSKTKYQIWNYWPNQLHWLSLIGYPLFLIFQQSIRNIKLLRKISFLFTLISYPCLFLFVQILLVYIKKYFEQYLVHLQITFYIYMANIIFFLLNQSIVKIKIKSKEKIIYLALLAFIINNLYNQIAQSSCDWTLSISISIYISTYFIHINENLFKDNKFIRQDKILVRIIIEKIFQPFQVNDNFRNLSQTHFVFKKNISFIYISTFILFYYLQDKFLSENLLIVISTIILMFVFWDTSLVSTSTRFTLKDQWLAANLFFLDFFLPIRNIMILLVLD